MQRGTHYWCYCKSTVYYTLLAEPNPKSNCEAGREQVGVFLRWLCPGVLRLGPCKRMAPPMSFVSACSLVCVSSLSSLCASPCLSLSPTPGMETVSPPPVWPRAGTLSSPVYWSYHRYCIQYSTLCSVYLTLSTVFFKLYSVYLKLCTVYLTL